MKVMELMHTQVVTVAPDSTARDAVDKMDLYQISGLPVVDKDNNVVGMVSEHDIIRYLVPSYGVKKVGFKHSLTDLSTQADYVAERKVSEIMSPNVIVVDENMKALDAAVLMLQHHIKRLPVTAEGKLVGIIGRIDICQAVLGGNL